MPKAKRTLLRDFFILLLLFCVLALFSFLLSRILYPTSNASYTEEITLTVEDVPYELLCDVKLGDRVLDRTHRSILGNITELSTTPHSYERVHDGESVLVNKEGYCDAHFRIRIDRDIEKNRQSGAFYIGASLSFSTPTYAGDGKIYAVYRAEAA